MDVTHTGRHFDFSKSNKGMGANSALDTNTKSKSHAMHLLFGQEKHKIRISDETTPEELHYAISAITKMPLNTNSGYTFKFSRNGRPVVGLKQNTEQDPFEIEIVYNLSSASEELQTLRNQFSKMVNMLIRIWIKLLWMAVVTYYAISPSNTNQAL